MTSEERQSRRDIQREQCGAYCEASRVDARAHHIAIICDALIGTLWRGAPLDVVAAAAIDALLADGVVFARMGSWDE